jgi:DNA-directed RNA polymerase specialized sigma24 family protein
MEQGEPSVDLLRAPIFTGPLGIKVVSGRAVSRGVTSGGPPSLMDARPTGIDLAVRGIEVRKLFYAAFARGLVKDGYDPEEALQEVYRGLLTRNNGTCPFDVTKSSFGHYVHIVSRCVLANYIRKERRRSMHEYTESSLSASYERDDGSSFSIEACPDIRGGGLVEPGSLERLASRLSPGGGGSLVARALTLLTEGYSRREVAQQLEVSSAWMTDLLKRSRELLSRGPELS